MDIGTTAPGFKLKNVNDQTYTLEDFFDSDVLVIIFTCNHCPYANAYDQRIKGLAETYNRRVQFVLINSNDAKHYPEDSFAKMQEAARAKHLKMPYLHDETQSIAHAYDAACTPHAFVFDKERKLTYEGAIDDNWKNPDLATETYLQDAIEATLSGRKPPVQQTNPIGCSIKWK